MVVAFGLWVTFQCHLPALQLSAGTLVFILFVCLLQKHHLLKYLHSCLYSPSHFSTLLVVLQLLDSFSKKDCFVSMRDEVLSPAFIPSLCH